MSKAMPTYDELQNKVQELEKELASRKLAEESTRESEEHFRELFEEAPLGYQSLDEKGCFITVNQAWLDIFGYERQEIIGKSVFDFISPQYQEKLSKTFSRFKKTGEISGVAFEIMKKDGSFILASIDGKIGHDKQGNFKQTHCVLQDITERRRAEDALTESKALYQDLVETSRVLVWKCDAEGRFIYLNKAWEKTIGYRLEEMLGHVFSEFQPKEVVERDRKEFSSHLEGESVKDHETIYFSKTGQERHLLFNAVPLKNAEGDIVGTQGTAHDITGRKLAEQEIKNLAKFPGENPNPVMRIFEDGTIIYANKGSNDLLNFWESKVGESLPDKWCKIVREIITSDTSKSLEIECEGRIVSLTFYPVEDTSYLNVYGIDITERKQAEEALKETEQRFSLTLKGSKITPFNQNKDLRYTWVYNQNPSLSIEEVIGKTDEDLIAPEDAAVLTKMKRHVLQSGNREEETVRFTVGGKSFYYALCLEPMLDSQARIIGIAGTSTDITEIMQAEEALRQSNLQYQTIGETIPYGVWLTDATGYCIYVSRSFLELVGMSMEQVQEFGWLHLLPPEDVEPTKEHWLHCVQTGENFEREHRFRTKDGSYRNVLAIGRPIKDDTGKIIKWAGLNLDITERKQTEEALDKHREHLEELVKERTTELRQSEARFKGMFANMSSGVAVYQVLEDGEDFVLIDYNPAAERIDNISKESVIGKSITEIFPGVDEFGLTDVFRRVWETGTPEHIPVSVYRDERIQGWRENFIYRLPSGEIVAIYDDVTERMHAEQELRNSETRLSEAQRVGHVGSWELDIKTHDLWWSDETYRMFGIEKGEFANTIEAFFEFVHPEDQTFLQEEMKTSWYERKPFNVDHRTILPGGEVRTFHELAEVIFDDACQPVRMIGTVQDITGRKHKENVQAAQLRLVEFAAGHTVMELLQKFLDEAEILTGSEIGFYHFVDDDQENVSLQAWSTNTLKNMCKAEGTAEHYPVSEAGVWVDCIRDLKPLIHNDYASLPHKKGLPEEHTPVIRELTVPVIRGKKALAILGVGNKRTDYDQEDIETVQQLADLAWETVVRKQAEEALRESEERLRTVIGAVHTGIVIIDPVNHTVIDINDITAELIGISKEQIIGKNCCDYFCLSEKDACPVTDLKQSINNAERIVKRADGQLINILKSVSTIVLGGKEHILETFIDITERKRTEEALRESEQQYRSLFENMINGFAYCKMLFEGNEPQDFIYLDVNEAFETLTGLQGVVGKKVTEVIPGIKETDPELFDIYGRVATTGKPESFEFYVDALSMWFALSVYCPKRGYFVAVFDVITKRKQAEAELQRSADVVNNIQVGLYIFHLENPAEDSSLRVVAANQAAVELLGIPKEDVVGRTIYESFPALREMELAKTYADVVRNGEGVTLEEVVYGDHRIAESYFSIKAFPLPGDCVGLAFEDITERKQMEQAITTIMENAVKGTGQEFFDQLVKSICEWSGADCTIVGEFVDDNKVKVLSMYLDGEFINDFTYDLVGTPCENACKNGYCTIHNDVQKKFPEDQDLVRMGAESYVGIPLSGKQGILCTISRKKLEVLPQMKEIMSILAARASAEIMRSKSDNALRDSEERFRNLVETSQDLIFRCDTEGRFTYLNSAWEEALGYKAEEMLGKKFNQFKSPETIERDKEKFAETLDGDSTRGYETIYLAKSGRQVHLRINSMLIRDREGQVIGTQGTAYDITERKLLEDERTKAAKLESIGILAGGIAHDFNNILTAIVGNISLAKMISTDESSGSGELLAEAEKSAMRAKDLTQQLLTFSKGGEPVKKSFRIEDLLTSTVRFTLRGSNVKCVFNLSDQPSIVKADEGQIGQVINNLVINADQAMSDGGLITISTEPISAASDNSLTLPAGKYVKITVKDQGHGIPEDQVTKIFDPYFTTKTQGSGLGLATSYSIIKRHGGKISVESEAGIGTSFHIYLAASSEPVKAGLDSKQATPLARGRVLVMDDEHQILTVVAKMLEHIGQEVEVATDGAEVTEFYQKAMNSGRRFDAVILDLTIPGGMGGCETMERLLEIDPNVKGIVSSGYSNDPVLSNYRDYGFSSVASKPYRLHELQSVLRSVMQVKDD